MEKKSFVDYTVSEQQELLLHWWHYYGKDVYTFEELEKYQDLIHQDSQTLFEVAAALSACGFGPQPLLKAMRRNEVEELYDQLSVKDQDPELVSVEKEAFISEIVDSYNHPEPDIPMVEETFFEQVNEILERNQEKEILTPKSVTEMFQRCMFQDEEIRDEMPTSEYTKVEGVMATVVLNTKRLNENKKAINEMIDQIKDIEDGPHFLRLCINKKGELWTGQRAVLDQIVVLGLATELLEVPGNPPREMWPLLPEGLPYVMKVPEKVDTPVIGKQPKEYIKKNKK